MQLSSESPSVQPDTGFCRNLTVIINSPPFEFLLLYGKLSLGGIETLIVRVANTFHSMGVRCTVLCTGGALVSHIDPEVTVIIYDDDDDARAKLKQRGMQIHLAETIVVTFDPTTCALAFWLDGLNAFGRCRHLTGVYHTRAYFLEGEDRLRLAINRLVLDAAPERSVIFMNEECRQTHADWSRRSFQSSPIIPLGIERKQARWQPSGHDALNIVSVGRLVGFKAYNLGSLEITRLLSKRGIDAHWQIYGSGELEPELRSRLSASADKARVVLRGDLPYNDFGSTIVGYDIFVGVGTAALEAAMLGMPALMALDSDENGTHGYLQDLPFGNLGELQPFPPLSSLHKMLENFYYLSLEEKMVLGAAGRAVALRYDVENHCLRLIEAGFVAGRPSRLRALLVGTVYREATTGRTRQIANAAWRWLRREERQH